MRSKTKPWMPPTVEPTMPQVSRMDGTIVHALDDQGTAFIPTNTSGIPMAHAAAFAAIQRLAPTTTPRSTTH